MSESEKARIVTTFEDRWNRICRVDVESRMTERETEFILSIARELDRLASRVADGKVE
jgi:hypothetical protein